MSKVLFQIIVVFFMKWLHIIGQQNFEIKELNNFLANILNEFYKKKYLI